MATKLVYNGSMATSFMSIGTELQPGSEFWVPDELVESFTQRSDIEVAPAELVEDATPTKPTKSTKPAIDEAPETE